LEGVLKPVPLSDQLTDYAIEPAQPLLQGDMLGLHLLRGLLKSRRGCLHLPCEVSLSLLEFADLFGEHLRLNSGVVEFGFHRLTVGNGNVVSAPRDTGAGANGRETQHPGCKCVNLHTLVGSRRVALHAIVQKAVRLRRFVAAQDNPFFRKTHAATMGI
jgi:hypothetical protein